MPKGIYQHKKMSEETKHKIALANIGRISPMKGKQFSEEVKIHMSDSRKGMRLSEETKKKIGLKSIGHIVSEETKQKIRLTKIGEKNPMFNKKLSKEHRYKISLGLKGRKLSDETREKISKSCIENAKINQNYGMRGKHLTPEQIKKCLESRYNRPTSYEKKISDLCVEYNLPFVYTGDGRFIINFKNPDFVNESEKIVIEVFYSYFKIRDYGSVENYKNFCKDKYNSYGWKVIFIDENEVDIDNWKEVCLNKIKGGEDGR